MASAAVAPNPARARCRPVEAPGLSASLGARAPEKSIDVDDDVGLPFAPEVGSGIPFEDGFAVGALEPTKDGMNAVVLVLSPALAAPKRIDLGRVHGDVEPPLPSVAGGALVVAVNDGAPHGSLLRLARVEDPAHGAAVVWGAEVSEGKDESDAFALELGPKIGILVWDEWSGKDGHGVVKATTFAGTDVSKTAAPVVLSGAQEDAENPVIAARPGGFWAAWIGNEKREPDKKRRTDKPPGPEAADVGPRWITLVPLDESGKASGEPALVTRRDGRIIGFDLATLKDGSALVAYREETGTGTAGEAHLVRARPDGSTEARVIAEDEPSVDVPTLLVDDRGSPSGAEAWLAVGSDSDAARLVALAGDGSALDDLAVEPSLGVGAPLAARGGKLFVARSRGRAVELSVFACEKGRHEDKPPAEPSAAPPEAEEP